MHAHLDALLGRERILGQSEQMRLLLGEGFAHAAGALWWTQPLGSGTLTPGGSLCVQIIEITEGARGEERIAREADGALDAPLLIAARHGHRARLVAIVGGQFQQPRMEAGIAGPIMVMSTFVACELYKPVLDSAGRHGSKPGSLGAWDYGGHQVDVVGVLVNLEADYKETMQLS